MILHTRRYAAECLGTGILTLVVSLSLVKSLMLPTPVIAAVIVGILVYLVGPISGAHLNPSVTLGMWSVKKIAPHEAALYIISQVVGALLALGMVFLLTDMVPDLQPQEGIRIAVAEALGAAILAFGVASVAFNRTKVEASGIVVGGSLLVGILLASSVANGILNPAVAIGAGSLSLSYVLGPLVGGIVGASLYQWIAK